MNEKQFFFQSQGVKLEGLLAKVPGERGVVVTHPHPLYGGNMHNNVVEAVIKAYREEGYSTLRFNFRGTGQSGGNYDEGVGEREDVRAALSCLADLGKTSLDLAGYSFGVWVNALGLKDFDHIKRTVMVSPPVGFMDFSFLDYNSKIQLVIAGSDDDIGPSGMIKDMIKNWNSEAQFNIIQGADHFYRGKTGEIERIIRVFLKD